MTNDASAAEIVARLRALGLARADENPACTPLDGGVSSDIWRVDLAGGPVCVKRALPKLKVARDWYAPVERSLNEARWLQFAGAAVPGSAPAVRAVDPDAKLFVMDYLDPATHTVWKSELLDGRVSVGFAEAVGTRLAALHAAAIAQPGLAETFSNDALFRAIRLEPYFAAAAERHAELEEPLQALIESTAAVKRTLVHGDISPKNILMGPDGPVFLDAECATWGDPAFDLAFVLNHLMLKCLVQPDQFVRYLLAYRWLFLRYRSGVTWEPAFELEARAGRLIGGLMLARVDGKSPVEYLTEPGQKRVARAMARQFLLEPQPNLDHMREDWHAMIIRWMRAGGK
jgi:aminoglycoside phosphotransferase (APT) family kinase protein